MGIFSSIVVTAAGLSMSTVLNIVLTVLVIMSVMIFLSVSDLLTCPNSIVFNRIDKCVFSVWFGILFVVGFAFRHELIVYGYHTRCSIILNMIMATVVCASIIGTVIARIVPIYKITGEQQLMSYIMLLLLAETFLLLIPVWNLKIIPIFSPLLRIITLHNAQIIDEVIAIIFFVECIYFTALTLVGSVLIKKPDAGSKGTLIFTKIYIALFLSVVWCLLGYSFLGCQSYYLIRYSSKLYVLAWAFFIVSLGVLSLASKGKRTIVAFIICTLLSLCLIVYSGFIPTPEFIQRWIGFLHIHNAPSIENLLNNRWFTSICVGLIFIAIYYKSQSLSTERNRIARRFYLSTEFIIYPRVRKTSAGNPERHILNIIKGQTAGDKSGKHPFKAEKAENTQEENTENKSKTSVSIKDKISTIKPYLEVIVALITIVGFLYGIGRWIFYQYPHVKFTEKLQGLYGCDVEGIDEPCDYFSAADSSYVPRLQLDIKNNSTDPICLNNDSAVSVSVLEYTPYDELKISNRRGGASGWETPVDFSADIGTTEKDYQAVAEGHGDSTQSDYYSFLNIEHGDTSRLLVNFSPEEAGLYHVQVKITYSYNNKDVKPYTSKDYYLLCEDGTNHLEKRETASSENNSGDIDDNKEDSDKTTESDNYNWFPATAKIYSLDGYLTKEINWQYDGDRLVKIQSLEHYGDYTNNIERLIDCSDGEIRKIDENTESSSTGEDKASYTYTYSNHSLVSCEQSNYVDGNFKEDHKTTYDINTKGKTTIAHDYGDQEVYYYDSNNILIKTESYNSDDNTNITATEYGTDSNNQYYITNNGTQYKFDEGGRLSSWSRNSEDEFGNHLDTAEYKYDKKGRLIFYKVNKKTEYKDDVPDYNWYESYELEYDDDNNVSTLTFRCTDDSYIEDYTYYRMEKTDISDRLRFYMNFLELNMETSKYDITGGY